jgi:hypothetical protein
VIRAEVIQLERSGKVSGECEVIAALKICAGVASQRGEELLNNGAEYIVEIFYYATTGEEIENLSCALQRSRVNGFATAL